MDISAIFYAALGGGGGALIGSFFALLIQKTQGKTGEDKNVTAVRGGVTAAFVAVGVFATGSLYKNMTLPRIVPLDDRALITETPIYGVIKEQNPEAYKEILSPVDRAVRNGDIKQADLDEMRAVLFKLIGAHMQLASGEILRSAEKNTQYQLESYREKAPRICTLLFNGEPFPALDAYLSESDIKEEQKVMVKLFTSDSRDPNFVPDLERGKVVLEAAILAPMKELSITDLHPDVSETAGNEDAHRKICDLAIAFSKNKQALSDDDLINAVSYLNGLQ